MNNTKLHLKHRENHLEGSRFYRTACCPNKAAMSLDEHDRKKKIDRKICSGIAAFETQLGFGYESSRQSYCTDDPSRVTCKNCIKKIIQMSAAENTSDADFRGDEVKITCNA